MRFSLSYEQMIRVAEERIRECELNSHGAKYISESAKAAAILGFWYELAINGAPLNNYELKLPPGYWRWEQWADSLMLAALATPRQQ